MVDDPRLKVFEKLDDVLRDGMIFLTYAKDGRTNIGKIFRSGVRKEIVNDLEKLLNEIKKFFDKHRIILLYLIAEGKI